MIPEGSKFPQGSWCFSKRPFSSKKSSSKLNCCDIFPRGLCFGPVIVLGGVGFEKDWMRGFVHSARWEGRVRIFHCQEITRGRKFSRRKLLRSSEKRKEKALKVRLFWSNLRGMKQNYYNFILFSFSPLQQMYKISEQMMAPASLFGDSEPTRDLFLIYNEFFNTWHSRRSLWKARFNIKREMMDLPSIDPLTEKKYIFSK